MAAASTHQYPVLRNLLPCTAEQCGRACTGGALVDAAHGKRIHAFQAFQQRIHLGTGIKAATPHGFDHGLPLLHQRAGGDAGHAIPHHAADGLICARVVDVGDGDGGGACGALDLGKAEVVDQLGAGDGRGRRGSGIRRAVQHQQAGLFGGGVVAQHHAVDAAAHGIGGGQGQCGGLLHDDAAALEPRRAHPCLPGAHLHAQAALCCDGKILLGAVYAAQAGG
nr:MAG: hypothetical protein [Bacteriophage sp.]